MINILPYNQKKSIEELRMLRVVTVTLWAAVALIAVAALLLVPLLVAINARYTLATNQIQQLEKSGIIANPVDIAALTARARTLSQKLSAPALPTPTQYIAVIRQGVSAGITLSAFSMESSETPSLEVAGKAATREALQKFVAALEKEETIASVESPVSNYVKSTNSQFSLTITFK